MSTVDYSKLNMAQLTALCAERKIDIPKTVSLKADYIQLLLDADAAATANVAAENTNGQLPADENSDDPSDLPPNGDGEETEDENSDDPSDLPPNGDGEEKAPLPIEETPITKVLPDGVRRLKAGTTLLLGNVGTEVRSVVLAADAEIYFADTERALVGLLGATAKANIEINADTLTLKYTNDGALAPLEAQTDEVSPEFLAKLDESDAHALGVLDQKRDLA